MKIQTWSIVVLVGGALLAFSTRATGVEVPFIESFEGPVEGGLSGWRKAEGESIRLESTGGADGENFLRNTIFLEPGRSPPPGSPLGTQAHYDLFRAPVTASGGGFTGDWLGAGVERLILLFRHDFAVSFFDSAAPFVRVISADGEHEVIIRFNPIVAGSWRTVGIDLDPDTINSSGIFPGGDAQDFNEVFTDVGEVIVGVIPQGIDDPPVERHFDLDQVWLFSPIIEPEPCIGDADGNGVINFADITAVLLNWLTDYSQEPSGTGPGDANGDGIVNFVDVTTVLNHWLEVCP